ncbi:hypothetical protein Aperf_G00000109290 [Anoplocephala perfoliata]
MRLNLVRESLPQLVQDYVQSQASIAVQNYIAKQQNQVLSQQVGGQQINSSSLTGTGTAAGVVDAFGGVNAATVGAVTDNATAHSSNSRLRSISNVANSYPTGGHSTPQTQKVGQLLKFY